MPIAKINGIAIHYDIEGDGPAVLLSHGYSATSEMWDRERHRLADRYRVLREFLDALP